VEVRGFLEDVVTGGSIRSSLEGTQGGVPNIESKVLVVQGSGKVDAVGRRSLGPGGDNISAFIGETGCPGHLWASGKAYGVVLDVGRGSRRPTRSSSLLWQPGASWFIILAEQVRDVHQVDLGVIIPCG